MRSPKRTSQAGVSESQQVQTTTTGLQRNNHGGPLSASTSQHNQHRLALSHQISASQAAQNSVIQNCTNLTTEDFEVIKVLGRGTFGIVRQVRCRRDGQVYAIKSIPLQKKKFTYKVSEQGNLHEVEIMTDLEHPHIIRMLASFTGLDFSKVRKSQL